MIVAAKIVAFTEPTREQQNKDRLLDRQADRGGNLDNPECEDLFSGTLPGSHKWTGLELTPCGFVAPVQTS